MPQTEFHALVPNAARTAFLVGEGGRLPTVTVDVETRVIATAIATFAEAHGLDATFLRVGRWAGEPARVLEFDAPAATPRRGGWRDLGALAEVVPPELAEDAERWAREQRTGSIPPLRSPWARPGWLAEASRWIRDTVPFAALEHFRLWPLSAVLVATARDGERFFFKAAFPLFAHEPVVSQALAREHPGLVPDVVAIDSERGWLLMRELAGDANGVDDTDGAMRTLAAIHVAWSGRAAEVLALGAPDRRLDALGDELASIVAALGGPADALPFLRRRLEKLHEVLPGETLVHGDFHPWNVVGSGGRLVIFDWSDACVAHPLFDLATFLRYEDVDRDAAIEAYVRARDDVDADDLRAAFEIAYPLACVHHAISYFRIENALEPTEQRLFGDAPRGWLELGVAAL